MCRAPVGRVACQGESAALSCLGRGRRARSPGLRTASDMQRRARHPAKSKIIRKTCCALGVRSLPACRNVAGGGACTLGVKPSGCGASGGLCRLVLRPHAYKHLWGSASAQAEGFGPAGNTPSGAFRPRSLRRFGAPCGMHCKSFGVSCVCVHVCLCARECPRLAQFCFPA